MREKLVYLLRHGDTGMKGRYIGSSDIGLAEIGVEQVLRSGVLLRNAGIDKVFCSPLLRCRQTLALLELPCGYHLREDLREINFGRWEKKSFAEIEQTDKGLVNAWAADPDSFCFPDGEIVAHFRRRVEHFLKQLDEMMEETLLIVSHGGVIRHILCQALGLSAHNYLIFDVQPGCYCTIRLFAEGGILTGFNLGG